MYAPTWRDDEFVKKGQYLFDLKINLENLQKELGENYVILLRMHYLIANALDLNGYEDFAIDVSNYSDISELYLISDALITDYSSVMFDFGILKRPQYFFAYDIEKYDKGLRGFYMDYMNDLPGEIITDEFKLAEELKIQMNTKKNIKTKQKSFMKNSVLQKRVNHLSLQGILLMKKQNKIFNLLGIATIIALFLKYKENIIDFINPYDDKSDYENIDTNDNENLI